VAQSDGGLEHQVQHIFMLGEGASKVHQSQRVSVDGEQEMKFTALDQEVKSPIESKTGIFLATTETMRDQQNENKRGHTCCHVTAPGPVIIPAESHALFEQVI
jgi:hypothetical protein